MSVSSVVCVDLKLLPLQPYKTRQLCSSQLAAYAILVQLNTKQHMSMLYLLNCQLQHQYSYTTVQGLLAFLFCFQLLNFWNSRAHLLLSNSKCNFSTGISQVQNVDIVPFGKMCDLSFTAVCVSNHFPTIQQFFQLHL